MGYEKLENKINKLMKVIKKGRLTEEIVDEVSNVIDDVEELEDDVKSKFSSSVDEMKKALKKMR